MSLSRRAPDRGTALARALLFALLLTAVTPIASAQLDWPEPSPLITRLSGEIIVDGPLTFGPELIVDIAPGTRFVAAHATAKAETPIVIVEGRLIAQGTSEVPIRFDVPLVIRSAATGGHLLGQVVLEGSVDEEPLLSLATPDAYLRQVTFAGGSVALQVGISPAPQALPSSTGLSAGLVAPQGPDTGRRATSEALRPAARLASPADTWFAAGPDAGVHVEPVEVAGLVFDDLEVSGAGIGILLDEGAPVVRLSNSTITGNEVGLRTDGGRAHLDHVTFENNRDADMQTASVGLVRASGTHVETSCATVDGRPAAGCGPGSIGPSLIVALLGLLYLFSEAGRYVLTRIWIWLKLFTRLDKEKLLEHRVRARLVELITERPGIHLGALVREVGGNGRTWIHLRRLEEAGFITSRRDGLRRRFYRPDEAPAPTEVTPIRDRLVAAVHSRPGFHVAGLARHLDLSRQVVAYHVRRLATEGLVVTERRDRRVWVHPAGDAPSTASSAAVHPGAQDRRGVADSMPQAIGSDTHVACGELPRESRPVRDA